MLHSNQLIRTVHIEDYLESTWKIILKVEVCFDAKIKVTMMKITLTRVGHLSSQSSLTTLEKMP